MNLMPSYLKGAVLIALLSLPTAASALTPFSDDFESGLSQWTGSNNGPHNGDIVADPLASGRGQVLYFTNFASGGDAFVSTAISLSGPIEIGFDYLGLPGLGGVPDDLGGYLGISYSLTPTTEGVDLFWLAGTDALYPSLVVHLVDDGSWHHYSIQLDATALPAFHLVLEDFSGSGGVTCDAFFDNISITAVPEPTSAALVGLGLLALTRTIRSRN